MKDMRRPGYRQMSSCNAIWCAELGRLDFSALSAYMHETFQAC